MARRAAPEPVVNGYSKSSTAVPAGPIGTPKLRPTSRSLAARVAAGPELNPAGGVSNVRTRVRTTRAASEADSRAVTQLPAVRAVEKQQRETTGRRADYEAAGGRAGRADVLPDRPVGHGMRLSQFGASAIAARTSPAHALDVVRGTSAMADPGHLRAAGDRGSDGMPGSGAKIPRTLSQGTPDINTPHDTAPNTIPARRWEDMHPAEQAKTLERVKQYGSTPAKMESDLTEQVLSAHARAGRNAEATPYSSRFYEGPSGPHAKIEEGADQVVAAHPEIPREHARAMVAVTNSATSPNVKFQQSGRFPNHEAAMHSLAHGLTGGDAAGVGRPEGVGGVYPANLEKASHFAKQMGNGAEVKDLKLQSGRRGFDPTHAPKTTDYVGAWSEPVGPDSRYVSDVHSTHSLMPHLSTAKSVFHKLADGSEVALHPHDKVPAGAKPVMQTKVNKETGKSKTVLKTAGSESEDYLAGDKVGLSALHDHIARKVATNLGLSHSVHNAGATHYTQATDWGEEQILRPDIIERTERTAYGRDERDPLRVPAGNERVSQTPTPPSASPFHTTRYVPPSDRRSKSFAGGAVSSREPDVQGRDRDKLERGVAFRSAAVQKKRKVKPAGDEHFDDDDPWAPRNQ